MMKQFFALILACCLWACSSDKGFRLEVEAPSIGTQEITVVYTTDDGNRGVATVPALKGHFEFAAIAGGSRPSVVEIFGANKRRIAALLLREGDDVSLQQKDSVWTAKGSELSQQLLDYRPGSTPVESLAPEVREVLELIFGLSEPREYPEFHSPELLIARDSVNTPDAEGVWVFTTESAERTRSLRDSMRAMERRGLKVRDVFVSSDTAYWRMITRSDSAIWLQGMLPDAPIALKGIVNYLPCKVEVDSAGRVVSVQRLP